MRKLMEMSAAALVAATALAAWAVGAGAEPRCRDVLAYLKADAEDRGGTVLRWGVPGPIVRVLAGSPEFAMSEIDLVVWAINKELPEESKLHLSKTPVKRTAGFELGVIKVAYLRRENWPKLDRDDPDHSGLGHAFSFPNRDGMMTAGAVLIDHTRVTEEHERIYILLHEFLHTLGRGHVDRDRFSDTIMHPTARRARLVYLKALDKAALSAVYSPLVPVGTRAGDLRCDAQGRIRGSR